MVPTNVRDGTKTSSFFFTPLAISAICIADVPLLTHITYFDLVKFLIFAQIIKFEVQKRIHNLI